MTNRPHRNTISDWGGKVTSVSGLKDKREISGIQDADLIAHCRIHGTPA
jgi:hypothetical protein